MNKTGFLFLGAVLSLAGSAAALAGCGSDTSGSGGGTTSTSTSTGTGGESTSTTSTTSTGMAATLDCASYCAEVATNCTGANQQYTSEKSCMAVCNAFPLGTLADTDGNTLGCRLYHGGGPAVSDSITHCPHAGITGGDKDVSDTTAGTCGEGCDAFCDVAIAVCTGANKQYDNKEACLTECKTFKKSAESFSVNDTDKDDFGCRAYHLSVAATDGPSAATHCGHIRAVSSTCTK